MIQYYTTGDGAINSCGGDNTGQEDKEKTKLNDYIKQLLSNQVNGWETNTVKFYR